MAALTHSTTPKPSLHKPLLLRPSISLRNPRATLWLLTRKRPPFSSAATSCRLKSPRDSKKSAPSGVAKRIVLSEELPPPLAEEEAVVGERKSETSNGVLGFVKRLPRKVLAVRSNLPLAIGEMFTVSALMAIGTAIDQGEAPDFYFRKYPEENPLFGFFTWRWVLILGFDQMSLNLRA